MDYFEGFSGGDWASSGGRDDFIMSNDLRALSPPPVLSWDVRVELACAEIWRLRQMHGLTAIKVEWHDCGEYADGRVATISMPS